MFNKIIISTLFTFVLISSLFSQDFIPRVSVVPFDVQGASKQDALVLSQLFEASLIKTGRYLVVEKSERDMLLDAQAFSLSGCVDDSCAIEIGQMLSADKIFLGTLSTLGSKYFLTVKLVDVTLGKGLGAETIEGSTVEELTGKLADIIPLIEGRFGTLMINTNPFMEVTVFINDEERGMAPGRFKILPGDFKVKVSGLYGGENYEGSATVLIEDGITTPLTIIMVPLSQKKILDEWLTEIQDLTRELAYPDRLDNGILNRARMLVDATGNALFDTGTIASDALEIYQRISDILSSGNIIKRLDQLDVFHDYYRLEYEAKIGPRRGLNVAGLSSLTLGLGFGGLAGYLALMDDHAMADQPFSFLPMDKQTTLISSGVAAGLTAITGIVFLAVGPDPNTAKRAMTSIEEERDYLSDGNFSDPTQWQRRVPFVNRRFNEDMMIPVDEARLLSTTPKLDWNDITEAETYFLQISSGYNILEETEIIEVEGSEYQIPDDRVLLVGDKVLWRVAAVGKDGVPGAWSQRRSFSITENQLTITSNPVGAEIFIDGQLKGITPMVVDDVHSGNHEIRVNHPFSIEIIKNVTLEVGPNDMHYDLVQPSIEMKKVPAGIFTMGTNYGASDERPAHQVEISEDFYMSMTEVTFEQYDKFADETRRTRPNDRGWGRGSQPVVTVSWLDAVDYCNWLSMKDGLTAAYTRSGNNVTCDFTANGYRLPTEAEWEYAASGGPMSHNYTFSGSNNAGDVAWYTQEKKHPVATRAPNELGLYDMSGNVWEWVWDYYDGNYYSVSPKTDPSGPASGRYKVVKGGGPNLNEDNCRIGYRNYGNPTSVDKNYGFRVIAHF